MFPSLAPLLAAVHHLQLLVRADDEVLKYLLWMRQVSQFPVFHWMHFWFLRSWVRRALFREVPSHVCSYKVHCFALVLFIVYLLLNLQQLLTVWAWSCGTVFSKFPLYYSLYLLWRRSTDWISHCHTANTSVWIHTGFSQSPRYFWCAPFNFF